MSKNLGCQLERRFRPLKPATHPRMSIPSAQGRSVRRYAVLGVLTTHDGDVFCLEDGLDNSLPAV
jgi:hypothetical protein